MEVSYNIEQLQACARDILVYFADFCNKNDLRYYLGGGTLLGAVRHKGFIPWDDDIDIAMPRPDFEKLISMRSEFNGRYILRYRRWDKDAYYSFLKVEDTTTTKIENVNNRFKYLGGVSIDVFPQDGMPDDYRKQKRVIKNYNRIVALRDYQIVFSGKKIKWMIAILNKVFFAFFPFDFIVRKYASKYPYNESTYARSFCGLYGDKETYKKELIGDGSELAFEGRKYPVPLHFHEYLTRIYGDYMKLPPIEKRIPSHPNEIIDLSKGFMD